ncbi:M1 family metallopeptidase [Streptomyces sp. NBC_00988]|uniref:M1 family metallopeptidase n=1 Tax=Streptomyces sp. NBC_00988 TaxID=2903704 RepID=UPI00386ED39C|nr:M1 family metallopeptidase [Streptomyces sp. NBC_00988]
MTRPDPHSYLTDDQPRIRHIDWTAAVDFDHSRLDCVVQVMFDRPGPAAVSLDTRALDIQAVRSSAGEPVAFEIGPHDKVLGESLSFTLPDGLDKVSITYATSPESTALQWVTPEQTSGGTHHCLYSQCQTIHARSMIPLHDSMSVRLTYTAHITVPEGYTALMSADSLGDTPGQPGTRTFEFSAAKPMPPYLVVLLAGHIESAEIGPRSRIWAEPAELDAAAWEFVGVEEFVRAGEEVYGPYPWSRADLVVMPPSYPYGGMENPQLTYLTPTVITGDRSLVDTLSHEIAHHWAGDMVTATSMEHFWLNEGFASWGERRMSETVHGRDVAEMHAAVVRTLLDEDLAYFADRPEHTRLRREMTGVDPDATSSWVSHEKGYLVVRAMEEFVGRERFDAFVLKYFRDFAFSSLTTEEFVDYARRELTNDFDYQEWLYAPGLPDSAPRAHAILLEEVARTGQELPDEETSAHWRAEQWHYYVAQLKTPQDPAFLARLDERYGFTTHRNLDIRQLWILVGLRSDYAPAVDAAFDMVARIGRMRFIKPLYDELVDNPVTRQRAIDAYAVNRPRYHPIAASVVDSRLVKLGIDPENLPVSTPAPASGQ